MQISSLSFRAFLIALLIHLLIFSMFFLSYYDATDKRKKSEEKKITIRLADSSILAPILPSGSVYDSVGFQRSHSGEWKREEKPKKEENPSIIETPPSDKFFPEPPQQVHEELSIPSGRVMHLIERHYGDIFEELSLEEQKYIIENIVTIHRIDRRIGNALLSDKPPNMFRDGDSNFVEMYLYPDGTISDITIIDEQSHKALDELTMETVEKSYSSYPRPNQKTLIRLHTRIQRGR